MAAKQINRITLFKIPNPADIPACVDAYVKLKQDAKKVCTVLDYDVFYFPFSKRERNKGTKRQVENSTPPSLSLCSFV